VKTPELRAIYSVRNSVNEKTISVILDITTWGAAFIAIVLASGSNGKMYDANMLIAFIAIFPFLLSIKQFRFFVLRLTRKTEEHPLFYYFVIYSVIGLIPSMIELGFGKPVIEVLFEPHHLLGNAFFIPLSVYSWHKSFINLDAPRLLKMSETTISIAISAYSVVIVYVIFFWNVYERNNWNDKALLANTIFDIIAFGSIFYFIVRVIAYNIDMIRNDREGWNYYIPTFPIISLAFCFMCWGSMSFYFTNNYIEDSFTIGIIIYVIVSILFVALAVWKKVRIKNWILNIALLIIFSIILPIYAYIGSVYSKTFLTIEREQLTVQHLLSSLAPIMFFWMIIAAILVIFDISENRDVATQISPEKK
jgi:hypothetical protein